MKTNQLADKLRRSFATQQEKDATLFVSGLASLRRQLLARSVLALGFRRRYQQQVGETGEACPSRGRFDTNSGGGDWDRFTLTTGASSLAFLLHRTSLLKARPC